MSISPTDRALTNLCEGAEFIIAHGIQHARNDDPHRFATLSSHFDQGKAMRRLVLDYLSGGQIRVTQLLWGTKDGEEVVVELFSTLVQGPQPTGAAH